MEFQLSVTSAFKLSCLDGQVESKTLALSDEFDDLEVQQCNFRLVAIILI